MKGTDSRALPYSRGGHPAELIHEIDRLMHERIQRAVPQMQRSCRMILSALSVQDNVTQLDLVHSTHLKAPTVSVSLQHMERDGIVHRHPDPTELRATRVHLTAKGREMDNKVFARIREQDKTVEDAITPEEFETLRVVLTKIRDSLVEGDISGEES